MKTLDLVDVGSGIEFGHGVHLDAKLAGDGERIALVLPGTERVAEDLAFVGELAKSYSVVMPSHPGFGLSPRPDWCASVLDIADIYLDWLERSGHTGVTLVGLQFGGWVATELAVRRPQQISSLVLVDSFGVKLGGPFDRDFVDVFAMPRADVERLIYTDPAYGLGDLGLAAEMDVLEMARNDEALATYGWEPYLHDPRLSHSIGRITVPTTVIWGERDGIVDPAHGQGLAARIPGARFEQIDGAGHRPQVERPIDVAQLISSSSV